MAADPAAGTDVAAHALHHLKVGEASVVELTFVAKHSLFKQPVVGQLLNATRAVPVAKPNDPDLPQEKQMKPEERQKLQPGKAVRVRACMTHVSVD